MQTKRCSRCRVVKVITDFNIDRRSPSGRQCTCNKCRESMRNRPSEVERTRQWRWNNPIGSMLVRARRRAKVDGLSFDITKDDIVIPTHCPVLDVPLVRARGRLTPNSPSLDRIVPVLGYVKGNVTVLSMKANTMKNNATPEELRRFAAWVVKTYGT